jgi:hypothetical protein
MPRPGRDTRELVIIYWRDIPAQVNAQLGRERHQIILGNKFQRAIDRAKRKARIYTAAEEVAQWRRESRPMEGDPVQSGEAVAADLDREYPHTRLGLLAYYGGWEADVQSTDAIDRDVLAALEELDDDAQDEEEAGMPGDEQENR